MGTEVERARLGSLVTNMAAGSTLSNDAGTHKGSDMTIAKASGTSNTHIFLSSLKQEGQH
jgi:hypothetical protein